MLGTSKNIWGFDPRSVPGCSLWLDGADSNSMTLSGSNVTAWTDKSPLATAFTLSNGSGGSTIRTTYTGLPVVQVSNSCFFNGSYSYPLATRSIFFVMAETVHSDWRGLLSFASNADQSDYNTQNGYTITATNTVGSNVQFSQNFGNGGFNFNYNASNGTKDVPFQLYEDVTSNTAVTLFITGSNVYSSNTSVTPLTSTGLTVGGRNGIPNTGALVIAEVLLYSNVLTTSQRQQVEGYLSHKWGLNGYYDSSIPLSIPGCQLWLDGADPAGTGVQPSNGTTISTWVDKSGNGRNATPTVTGPTYTTNIFNGYSAPVFNGTIMVTPSYLITTDSKLSIFVLCKKTGLRQAGGNSDILNIAAGYQYFALYIRTALTDYLEVFYQNTPIGLTNYAINDGTNLLVSILTNGLSIDGYLSGTSVLSSTPNNGYSMNNLTTQWKIAEGQFVGPICEIIIFNSTFTTTQRQSIEGYLARKWGFTSMYSALPSIHPFSSIRPHLRPFQPTDIPGCQLWLDAADSSTLVLSGSNVTQWNNKGSVVTTATPTRGSTANQITYVTVDGYPGVYINNNNSVLYNSSTYSQLTIQSNFQTTIDYSVFAVVNLSNTTVSGVPELQTIYANARGTSGETRSPNFGAGITLEYISDGTNRSINSSFIGTGRLQTSLTSSTSALTAYKNGTVYASNTSSFTRASSDSGALPMIGGTFGASISGASDNRFATGYFHELLVFNTALTTSQRQQVEGYLAHKWGLTPSYSSTTPLSISGCTLWLDGADPAGTGVTPSNGATVSTWVDKSGNGLTVSAASSQPTYVTNAANGLGTVAFNGSQGLSAGTVTGTKLIGNTNSCAIYAVVRFENTSGRSIPYSWDDQTYEARFLLQYAEGNNIALLKRGGTNTTIPLINTLYYIVSYWQNGLNTQLNVNGTTIASLSNFSNNDISSFSRVFNVGYYANDPAGWNMRGNIAEIIFFNTHIPNDFKKVEGYLARKWGISISATLPSLHPFKSFPPAKAPMIIGLVNRWIFNNGSGSTVTDTVGGQNISLSGTYTWSSSVPNSEIATGSLSFNGYSGSGSASVNATLQTSTYTMTLWYYHTGVSDPYGGNPMILQSGFNQNEAFSFATGGFTGTSKPYFYSGVYNGGFGRTFSSATPLNTWTHLAVTIGNSTYNAYQNGVLDSGNTNISITSGLPLTLNGSFIFAKGDSAYGNRFGGSLFDVRIYNRALSASEISQIYNGIG